MGVGSGQPLSMPTVTSAAITMVGQSLASLSSNSIKLARDTAPVKASEYVPEEGMLTNEAMLGAALQALLFATGVAPTQASNPLHKYCGTLVMGWALLLALPVSSHVELLMEHKRHDAADMLPAADEGVCTGQGVH